MKKIYLKPMMKRVEITEKEPLMDVSLTVNDQTADQEVDQIEDLLGNSVNVWED
ncbi:MAG: hypothetical protein IKX36_00235 [Prevotella sp.]|nr:hypothetical protein [Prevotella sp.]